MLTLYAHLTYLFIETNPNELGGFLCTSKYWLKNEEWYSLESHGCHSFF